MEIKTYDLTLRFSVNSEKPEVLENIKLSIAKFVRDNLSEELKNNGIERNEKGIWDKVD